MPSGPQSSSPVPLTNPQIIHSPPHTSPISIRPSSPPNPPRTGMTTPSHHGIFKPNPKYTSQALSVSFSSIPKYPIHAHRDPNWKQAMKEEFDALIKNHT